MSQDDLKARLTGLLAGLGNDPDAVASSLLRAGARGRRNNPCECPLANHLKALLPGWRFFVNSMVTVRPPDEWRIELALPLPSPCRSFAARYDDGRYPLLDADTNTKGGAPCST